MRFIREKSIIYFAYYTDFTQKILCVLWGHMEIKRKIYDKILNWKQTCNGSKALLIEGARRIGKKIAMQYIIHPKNLMIEGEIIKIPPYMFDVAFK